MISAFSCIPVRKWTAGIIDITKGIQYFYTPVGHRTTFSHNSIKLARNPTFPSISWNSIEFHENQLFHENEHRCRKMPKCIWITMRRRQPSEHVHPMITSFQNNILSGVAQHYTRVMSRPRYPGLGSSSSGVLRAAMRAAGRPARPEASPRRRLLFIASTEIQAIRLSAKPIILSLA